MKDGPYRMYMCCNSTIVWYGAQEININVLACKWWDDVFPQKVGEGRFAPKKWGSSSRLRRLDSMVTVDCRCINIAETFVATGND